MTPPTPPAWLYGFLVGITIAVIVVWLCREGALG